ncbi:hypothetical protein BRYFOR_07640 [Marvinbryantia formatexigens DSM 14469]|uniref:Uncharacterized protein n=1 Tax=Marvinbryantia formatexigens DSM 14469 TaxID=478749 RepID=C6LG80_9FIRM|nr:hypothetical protein BRYFOR_07640 [Marvinbryantia formatexigens DSM 14469]
MGKSSRSKSGKDRGTDRSGNNRLIRGNGGGQLGTGGILFGAGRGGITAYIGGGAAGAGGIKEFPVEIKNTK